MFWSRFKKGGGFFFSEKKKVSVTFFVGILSLVLCGPAFSQALRSGQNGIQKEFYRNGTLKLEYTVKDERLNGPYIKYDENGDLEYRQYYINGIFDGVDQKDFYYELFSWYQHFLDEGPEVLLTEAEAVKKFSYGYRQAEELKEGNKMGIVRTIIPAGEDGQKRNPVALAAISRNYIYLKEYEDVMDIQPDRHYFYQLIHKYKVRRGYDIDGMFSVPLILEVFQRRHTAVEYGTPFGRFSRREWSRLFSVQQFLGEPDYVYPLMPAGWFDVYYEKINLHIMGHNSAVYFMEERRPEWAKTPKYKNKNKFKIPGLKER